MSIVMWVRACVRVCARECAEKQQSPFGERTSQQADCRLSTCARHHQRTSRIFAVTAAKVFRWVHHSIGVGLGVAAVAGCTVRKSWRACLFVRLSRCVCVSEWKCRSVCRCVPLIEYTFNFILIFACLSLGFQRCICGCHTLTTLARARTHAGRETDAHHVLIPPVFACVCRNVFYILTSTDGKRARTCIMDG